MKYLTALFFCFCQCSTLVLSRSADIDAKQHQPQRQNKKLEDLLLSVPDRKRLRNALYHLTKKSHVAATRGDWENAYYVRDKLIEFGFDAAIEDVPVMMTYPLERPELSASFGYHAKLSEDVLEEDVTSGTTEWRNHTFLAYSPTGKVTAKLVYANYGRPQDFDKLSELGVSVQGAIVIMRYGKCFRGLKIMNAEERGAIGSIIYTDPQEDGFTKGPTFPEGPWRPPSSVQRGSVQYNSRCAGDPWRIYQQKNSGGKSAVKDTCGYDTQDLIPSHPALPLSYEDAKPLLEKLGGPVGPADFQGGLPVSYSVGPSTFDVTMETNHTFYVRKIPNVIATMKVDDITGNMSSTKEAPSIILGNHRDAWVFGAVDPNSGTTALLEVARTLQVLRNQGGWKPKRNIILASWSGEEYGLLGSTAYAELNAEKINDNLIAYLNVDSAVSGNVSFGVSATHSLEPLIRQAAQSVPAPPSPATTSNKNRTMADVWDKVVGTLGSGSDYTAFLDRYGIISADMKFDGNYGVYHSVYDSFSWMEQQGDPNFFIHEAMTRIWALMAFRLASTDILPIYMTPQAVQMKRDIEALSQTIQQKQLGGSIDLSELQEGSDLFHQAALDIDNERDAVEKSAAFFDGEFLETADINRRLSLVERQFLGPGLPKRPWFRHVLQSPGYYLGYGSQAFPGIAQAINDGDLEVAQSEVSVAATAVINAASFLVKGEDHLLTTGADDLSSQI